MELVLDYSHRRRPIISFPFAFGYMQGAILEKLHVNLFTVTRAQVRSPSVLMHCHIDIELWHVKVEQLRKDNIVTEENGENRFSFKNLIAEGYHPPLRSLVEILPQYLQ